jgi:hypothetical protein
VGCEYLGEEIGHELIVVANGFTLEELRLLRSTEANELTWIRSTLMEELIEAMLAIGARFSKVDDSGLIVE